MVYKSDLKKLKEDMPQIEVDEAAFWLYSQVMEAVLPMGYFCLIIEPQVLVKVFKYLLDLMDPISSKILGEMPELVFQKHFTNLFSEFKNRALVDSIFDMLFLLGCGSTASTLSEPDPI